jgi:hypothetical protein
MIFSVLCCFLKRLILLQVAPRAHLKPLSSRSFLKKVTHFLMRIQHAVIAHTCNQLLNLCVYCLSHHNHSQTLSHFYHTSFFLNTVRPKLQSSLSDYHCSLLMSAQIASCYAHTQIPLTLLTLQVTSNLRHRYMNIITKRNKLH